MTQGGFEIFEVTADQGIHAFAPDLPGLFRQAALGLCSLMVQPTGVERRDALAIHTAAPDRDALLVAWLNDLLFVHEVHGFAPRDVAILWFAETALDAEVWGETLDPVRHQVVGHVKAATYHGLQITGEAGRWDARVIVDV